MSSALNDPKDLILCYVRTYIFPGDQLTQINSLATITDCSCGDCINCRFCIIVQDSTVLDDHKICTLWNIELIIWYFMNICVL